VLNRRIAALACLVVGIMVGMGTRVVAAPDPGQRGPYEVGFTSYLLTDSSRPGDGSVYAHRPIPVSVWYPVDPQRISPSSPKAMYPLDPLYETWMLSSSTDWERYGVDAAYQEAPPSASRPFPLVMFSPGWGGPAWVHTSVGTRLASHGFVVAVLYHFGDAWWPWEQFHHIALASWNRPRDVSFALTSLLARNTSAGDLLQGLIRPDQVAASGWSLGGYAAMTLAGGDDNVCDFFLDDPLGMGPPPPETCTPSPTDARIKAIVPLDGSNQLLMFKELTRVAVPSLGMGEEWTMLGDSWQARQHAAFSSRPGYRADVFNTIHQSFCDLCEAVPALYDQGYWPADWGLPSDILDGMCAPFTPSTEVHRLVGQYMVAFLKTYLAGERGYQSILTPGWAQVREPLIEFFVTEKRNPNAIDEEWPADFVYFMHQPGSEQARGPKNPAVVRVVPHARRGSGQ
jgi:dienelactone hydrolase